MLDFRKVGADIETHRAALGRRPGFDLGLIDQVKVLWERRSESIHQTQKAQEARNQLNQSMKTVMRSGTDEEKTAARADAKAVSDRVKGLEAATKEVEAELEALMAQIPNLPHPSIPDGADESANEQVKVWGDKPSFDFEPLEHHVLGVDHLGVFDFERAAKITGARFVVEYDDAARLERALASFMLDVHTREHGYREVAVPYMVNRDSLFGTGQLPKFEADLFAVPSDSHAGHFLIPTAEVPVTNLYRDTVLNPDNGPLPHTFACFTACFRSEAGSAGKDTHGIIRQHQFNKVELVRFVAPETSYDELDLLVRHAETILEKLELHYRTVLLCVGDISANAAKCFDIEVWLPGQGRYREISSCSNFEDFQARRAKIRFKTEQKGKTKLVHTLNGSGLAIGRTLVAIFEQYQDADGGVRIPEVLVPYMGGQTRIEPKNPRK